jgi:DNA polymerase-3 subunit beta
MLAEPALDLTAQAAPLAEAAARIARLLPARSLQPVLAGVLLRAEDDVVLFLATDGELSVRVRVPAAVHAPGEVLVSRRALAETLAALDAFEVRLAVEGSRLALRTPAARFALPRLDTGAYPPAAELPPAIGTVGGEVLRAAAVPVASAASREHALPIFTGIRLRSSNDRLSLVATDRFRMASATIPWRPEGAGEELDSLVPGALLAEVAKQVGRVERLVVHADRDRFGLAWPGGSVVTTSLGSPFPDQQIDRLLDTKTECAVEVDADALAAAVDRASPYAGPHGKVAIQAIDGVLVVRGNDPVAGESEETVKAAVRGDHLTRTYQSRYLLDALRPFARRSVRMEIQPGMRATVFSVEPAEDHPDLRYLVVPMREQAG